MSLVNNHWKSLFLFCLGLTIASTLCMKWLEPEFWVNGEKFTMIGLELFYPKEKVLAVTAGIDTHTRSVLSYHLYFDFVFMAGIFPGIVSLCMMARQRSKTGSLRKLLLVLAWLQLIAWAGDITEDLYLLKWLKHPLTAGDFKTYHLIVYTKWLIALTGLLIAVSGFLISWKKSRN